MLEGDEFDVASGAAVDVPAQAAHRIANTGSVEPLVFIEVQRGDYLGEDDIVRLEDDFGRAVPAAREVTRPQSPRAAASPTPDSTAG